MNVLFPIVDIIPLVCRHLRPGPILSLRTINKATHIQLSRFDLGPNHMYIDYIMEGYVNIIVRNIVWESIGYTHVDILQVQDPDNSVILCYINEIHVDIYTILHLSFARCDDVFVYIDDAKRAKYAVLIYNDNSHVLSSDLCINIYTYINAVCEWLGDVDDDIRVHLDGKMCAIVYNLFKNMYDEDYLPMDMTTNEAYIALSQTLPVVTLMMN